MRDIVVSRISLEEKYNFFKKDLGNYTYWLTGETTRIVNCVFNLFYLINFVSVLLVKLTIITGFHVYFTLITIFGFSIFLIYAVIWKKKLEKWTRIEGGIEGERNKIFNNFSSGSEVLFLENKMNILDKILSKLRYKFFFMRNRLYLKRELIAFTFLLLIIGANNLIVILSGIFSFDNLISITGFFILNYYVVASLWDANNISNQILDLLSEKSLIRKYKFKENKKDFQKSFTKFVSLSLNRINFSFGDKKILKDFSMEILRGEKIMITGPSGAGKSTLSLIISGILKPKSGEIKFNNKIISTEELKELSKFINYASKNCSIFRANLKENLTLFRREFTDKKIKEVLKILELGDWDLSKKISESRVSFGQLQRIILARELIDMKDILILDEAFSNVEARLREKIENFLLENKNITLINITHNTENQEKYSKVIEINDYKN